jgi:hypothetical protein
MVLLPFTTYFDVGVVSIEFNEEMMPPVRFFGTKMVLHVALMVNKDHIFRIKYPVIVPAEKVMAINTLII